MLGWCPAGDILISWGEGFSLASTGNPCRDGVNPSRIMVWRYFTYEWIMFTKHMETNNVNGSQLAEQRPSSSRCSRHENIGCHHTNPVISNRRKWSSQGNKIVMECYLLSKPKVRCYKKHMLSLWLNKDMFWVSEQRLVDQANTIHRKMN